MGTSCTVTAKYRDGKWRQIYIHFDGYPDYTGRKLLSNYNTQEQVESLLEKGSLSCLESDLEQITDDPVIVVDSPYVVVYNVIHKYIWDGKEWEIDGENLQEIVDQL